MTHWSLTCTWCGTAFTQRRIGRRRLYCSTKCLGRSKNADVISHNHYLGVSELPFVQRKAA